MTIFIKINLEVIIIIIIIIKIKSSHNEIYEFMTAIKYGLGHNNIIMLMYLVKNILKY